VLSKTNLYVKKKVQVRGKEGEKDLGGSIFNKVFVYAFHSALTGLVTGTCNQVAALKSKMYRK
jgi:hypothetical protein